MRAPGRQDSRAQADAFSASDRSEDRSLVTMDATPTAVTLVVVLSALAERQRCSSDSHPLQSR